MATATQKKRRLDEDDAAAEVGSWFRRGILLLLLRPWLSAADLCGACTCTCAFTCSWQP
jgi:hypothetical protein